MMEYYLGAWILVLGILAAAFVLFPLFRAGEGSSPERQGTQARPAGQWAGDLRALESQLADLEEDHAAGKISFPDYVKQRMDLIDQAAVLLATHRVNGNGRAQKLAPAGQKRRPAGVVTVAPLAARSAATSVAAEVGAGGVVSGDSVSQAAIDYCPYCGAVRLFPGQAFCHRCGQKWPA